MRDIRDEQMLAPALKKHTGQERMTWKQIHASIEAYTRHSCSTTGMKNELRIGQEEQKGGQGKRNTFGTFGILPVAGITHCRMGSFFGYKCEIDDFY